MPSQHITEEEPNQTQGIMVPLELESLGSLKQAGTRPIAHVASQYQVGPRFVQGCLEGVASIQLAKRGLSLEEGGELPTPRYLGIDEFARRKGHRYDTILCDLDGHHVLEVSA